MASEQQTATTTKTDPFLSVESSRYTVPNRTPCTVDSNGRRERKNIRKKKGAFIRAFIYLFIEPPAAAAAAASSASELSWAKLLSSVEERERDRARERASRDPAVAATSRQQRPYSERLFKK